MSLFKSDSFVLFPLENPELKSWFEVNFWQTDYWVFQVDDFGGGDFNSTPVRSFSSKKAAIDFAKVESKKSFD